MLTLREIVASQTSAAEELPLVHTTRCEILDLVLGTNELSEPECEIFHEHVVYFFYGRPAYRRTGGDKPGGGVELCPVCFVFKPHTISSHARRIFACDTGGVHYGAFRPHLERPDVPQLELEPRIESARRLVPLVFGSNGDYFRGQAAPILPAGFPLGGVGERYHRLLREKGTIVGDDRRSAIEVQIPSPVPLGHDLLYVVLPFERLNRPEVRRAIFENWKCTPIGYDVVEGTAVNECAVTIRDSLRRRFQEDTRI